jgi:Bacterial PH domain
MLIKSTVRGYLGNIVTTLTISAVLLTIAWYLASYIDGHLVEAGIGSIWEAGDVDAFDYNPFPFLAYGLMWLLHVFIALGVFEIFHNTFYDARETTELQADGKNWSKVSKRKYSFPAARETDTAVINRVTEVTVSESTIDRIFGTGTLQLKLTVFLNATEAQMEWKIPAVENPHEVAEAIRSKSLGHDGTRTITTLVPRGEMPA